MTGQEIEYWGVVVQTQEGSAADGCYVLKTVQNRDPRRGLHLRALQPGQCLQGRALLCADGLQLADLRHCRLRGVHPLV